MLPSPRGRDSFRTSSPYPCSKLGNWGSSARLEPPAIVPISGTVPASRTAFTRAPDGLMGVPAPLAVPRGYQPSLKYWYTRAATPAARGEDMDVPDMAATDDVELPHGWQLPCARFPGLAENISSPVAMRSGLSRPSPVGPREEKSQTLSGFMLGLDPLSFIMATGRATPCWRACDARHLSCSPSTLETISAPIKMSVPSPPITVVPLESVLTTITPTAPCCWARRTLSAKKQTPRSSSTIIPW
mmetsp:Transcript_2384/g.5668  ORF Transcript_2384/g.5668 Transcript_2384/m.5668 type:complete len:244 (+) Transcript_2384:959-1690(+)